MRSASLPPGPKVPLAQTIAYVVDPYRYFHWLRRRYGDPVTLRGVNGTIVITGDPEGVKQVFAARSDVFEAFAVRPLEPVVGKSSLLLLGGQTHAQRRKLMTPPFHGERMHAFGRTFQRIARTHVARIPVGTPFRMQDLTSAITLDAIVRLVFGISEEREIEPRMEALSKMIDRAPPEALFLPALQRDGYPRWARLRRATEHAEAMIYRELARRRTNGSTGSDILSMMMAARFDDGSPMSDRELRDQLVTLLLAGHETTSSALAWAFYWLHRLPDVMQNTLDEIRGLGADPDPAALAKLPYLEAVCHESLRLNPIVTDVVRKLIKPFELLGYEIPAGLGVGASTVLAHTHPDCFPEPEKFKPERFLGRTPPLYMPFGGGIRRCIGAAFAIYEMKVVLGTLLSEYGFARRDTREVRAIRRNITLGPRGGVEMTFLGRAAHR